MGHIYLMNSVHTQHILFLLTMKFTPETRRGDSSSSSVSLANASFLSQLFAFPKIDVCFSLQNQPIDSLPILPFTTFFALFYGVNIFMNAIKGRPSGHKRYHIISQDTLLDQLMKLQQKKTMIIHNEDREYESYLKFLEKEKRINKLMMRGRDPHHCLNKSVLGSSELPKYTRVGVPRSIGENFFGCTYSEYPLDGGGTITLRRPGRYQFLSTFKN